MAFTDTLIDHSDAHIVMVDRRHAPGGHWTEAYPFVRLHQPSAFYGVNSTPLGTDAIDKYGINAGHYERASGPEIVGYFRRVMDQKLLPSGRVDYFPMCDYVGENKFVSRVSNKTYKVKVQKKRVDAAYLQPSIPASYPPPFEVAAGVSCVPINALSQLKEPPERTVIIGGGKTAMDACLWLLECGVSADDICWVRPRDSLLANRKYFQPGDLALEGFADLVECAAQAETPDDLVNRLIASKQFFPMDEDIKPAMFKYATINERELELLRTIRNVVRLGKVRRIEGDTIICEKGAIPTSPNHLHVHCAAPGLRLAPCLPIFGEDTITLQPIRAGASPFAAAITAYIEATRDDINEKNKLCPPNPYMDAPADLVRVTLTGMNADYQWSKHPDITLWLQKARLNPTRGIMERMEEPGVRASITRLMQNSRPAAENLKQMLALKQN
ncbi:MAG: NAD(P)-dependent oxidoreductase [Desulfobacteraceae bacterium]|nr:NAD(P)-dependent oxidoreductase [Desulfobacteraceae bacterium]